MVLARAICATVRCERDEDEDADDRRCEGRQGNGEREMRRNTGKWGKDIIRKTSKWGKEEIGHKKQTGRQERIRKDKEAQEENLKTESISIHLVEANVYEAGTDSPTSRSILVSIAADNGP